MLGLAWICDRSSLAVSSEKIMTAVLKCSFRLGELVKVESDRRSLRTGGMMSSSASPPSSLATNTAEDRTPAMGLLNMMNPEFK